MIMPMSGNADMKVLITCSGREKHAMPLFIDGLNEILCRLWLLLFLLPKVTFLRPSPSIAFFLMRLYAGLEPCY
jgi:hypothetical protein